MATVGVKGLTGAMMLLA